MDEGVSAAQGCGLLLGLRARRLLNMSIRGGRWSGEGKERANLILLLIIAPLIAYQAHVMSVQAIAGAQRSLGAGALVRRYCPIWIIRNFQAFCTLVAVSAMALALAPALAASNESQMRHPFIWKWFGGVGNWPTWLPTGAAARLIAMLPSSPAIWMQGMSLIIMVTLIVFAIEWVLLRAMVAGGVIEAGGVLRGRV